MGEYIESDLIKYSQNLESTNILLHGMFTSVVKSQLKHPIASYGVVPCKPQREELVYGCGGKSGYMCQGSVGVEIE